MYSTRFTYSIRSTIQLQYHNLGPLHSSQIQAHFPATKLLYKSLSCSRSKNHFLSSFPWYVNISFFALFLFKFLTFLSIYLLNFNYCLIFPHSCFSSQFFLFSHSSFQMFSLSDIGIYPFPPHQGGGEGGIANLHVYTPLQCLAKRLNVRGRYPPPSSQDPLPFSNKIS